MSTVVDRKGNALEKGGPFEVLPVTVSLSSSGDSITVPKTGTKIIMNLVDPRFPKLVWYPESPLTMPGPPPTGVGVALVCALDEQDQTLLEVMVHYHVLQASAVDIALWALEEPNAPQPVRVDPQLILEPDGGTDTDFEPVISKS